MNQIQKLQQIEYTDHYSVFNRNGNKICDSATLQDALLMCSFDSTRTYKQVKILMDQVVNVPSTRMEDDLTNMLCACRDCNISKGHQLWSDWYLNQSFFTTERLSAIIEWQNQITDKHLEVYIPRKI